MGAVQIDVLSLSKEAEKELVPLMISFQENCLDRSCGLKAWQFLVPLHTSKAMKALLRKTAEGADTHVVVVYVFTLHHHEFEELFLESLTSEQDHSRISNLLDVYETALEAVGAYNKEKVLSVLQVISQRNELPKKICSTSLFLYDKIQNCKKYREMSVCH
jgi:hypothetical protein